jgi:outer membrane protein TolC
MKKYFFPILFFIYAGNAFGQSYTLNYFIEKARDNSPLLKDYRNQVLSNQLDSAILRASLRTQVNFLSTNSYAPVIAGWGYDEAISNIANVSAIVQANRNFVTRNNLSAQLMSIALAGRALTDTIHLTERDIARTITEQYITTYGDQTVLDYNKEILDLLKREDTVLKKLTQQSVFRQTDYLNFYVTLQQQELVYLQSQAQYNTDYLTLNYLAGVVDTSARRIEEPLMNDTLQFDFSNSVFYQGFVTDSLRLDVQRKLVAYEYKPKIGAYTDAGFNSSLQVTPYKNFGFSMGVSLTIPIYDGQQKRMKLSKIDIQEKTRQSNKEFYTNQYIQQAALLKHQLYEVESLVQRIRQQINYTHTLITANARLLETGDIAMRDYVLSINNYLTARNLLIQNNISRLRILNQLNYWSR